MVIFHSYVSLPPIEIVDLAIINSDFPVRYVSLPECISKTGECWEMLLYVICTTAILWLYYAILLYLNRLYVGNPYAYHLGIASTTLWWIWGWFVCALLGLAHQSCYPLSPKLPGSKMFRVHKWRLAQLDLSSLRWSDLLELSLSAGKCQVGRSGRECVWIIEATKKWK